MPVADPKLFPGSKPKDKLGIAILGLGEYSTESLMPALVETKSCYLAALVSDKKSNAEEWRIKYKVAPQNVYTYDTFDTIKDNPEIDIVYVVLPNSMHLEYVIRAAKAGKHVICEKPMAITVEDCDKMIEACHAAGKTLSVGYRLRFEPYNLEMMDLAAKKVYGDIKKITANNGISKIDGWRLNKELAGGGPLMDVGVYCIQAARYITGLEPVAVTATEGDKTDQEKFKEVEQSLTWQMEMPGGIMADCRCSYSEDMSILKVEASDGFFELSPAFAYADIKGKTSGGEMQLENVNQQVEQLDAIALAIKSNRPSPVPGEMGRQDVKILQGVYLAMRTGGRVQIL